MKGNNYETIYNCRNNISDTCFNSAFIKANLSSESNVKYC